MYFKYVDYIVIESNELVSSANTSILILDWIIYGIKCACETGLLGDGINRVIDDFLTLFPLIYINYFL